MLKRSFVGLSVIVMTLSLFIFYKNSFFLARLDKTYHPNIQGAQVKNKLSPEAYNVMYQAGTERPFSSPLDFETRKGTYVSADTDLPLFRSEDKYDSGTGWPSFTKPISPEAVMLKEDHLLGTLRTEVLTSDTHAHLGHVFDDGPPPLGKRWCMNGVALRFIPDAHQSTKVAAPE